MESCHVVVVGAGPVGLLTAIELALGGVKVVVLERLSSPSLVTKALGMGPRGSEALLRRGLAEPMAVAEAQGLDAMRAWAEHSSGNRIPSRMGGHFAGLALIRREAQKEPERRVRLVDQQAVEAMLTNRAQAMGIEIRHSCDMIGFAQHADSVDVDVVDPTGGARIRCAWLIGCDGGRSQVRKMAGFAFPGVAPTLTMYSAVAEIDRPELLWPIGWRHGQGGIFAYGPFPSRLIMLDFSGPPADREAPITREEVDAVLGRVSGLDVHVTTLKSASRWIDNTRLVDTYRRDRVLLAGDAAHVHSPFGGQGMSLGLGDAQNLGWKLAAVVRGEKPDTLLDSYTAERRPVAEAVLANTLAQAALMRPDPQSKALRAIVATLMQGDEVNRFFGEMISGLDTRYDLGSDRDDVGRMIGDRPVGEDGSTLYDLMREGEGVLLDAGLGEGSSALLAAAKVRRAVVASGPSMLIRPDGCVAWAGEDRVGLDDALLRWFGEQADEESTEERQSPFNFRATFNA